LPGQPAVPICPGCCSPTWLYTVGGVILDFYIEILKINNEQLQIWKLPKYCLEISQVNGKMCY
jgi:hypothetical protein